MIFRRNLFLLIVSLMFASCAQPMYQLYSKEDGGESQVIRFNADGSFSYSKSKPAAGDMFSITPVIKGKWQRKGNKLSLTQGIPGFYKKGHKSTTVLYLKNAFVVIGKGGKTLKGVDPTKLIP